MKNKSEIIIYQSVDGWTQIDVKLEGESVWLAQEQLAELFQTTKQNISLHIQNIYSEKELDESSTVKEYLTVQKEGKRSIKRKILHYNLDMIISLGYRVKSHIATHFRIWATKRLKEYIIKGFILDDERLKLEKSNYFDELLARIRDIRSSEKVFYRKICDIYATSVDYDPDVEMTKTFFATVQNKLHYAVHKHTAAEIIYQRADSKKRNMGLTNFPGKSIKKRDVSVAKNYLNEEELNILNRLVSQYLEFAELQALNEKTMYMKDWIKKLNDLLIINEKEILNHSGKISHDEAEGHALKEYENYSKEVKAKEIDELDNVLKKLNPPKKQRGKDGK